MPFINDGMDLGAMVQLMGQNRQRKDQQAMNMIGLAKPGQTIEQLGIAPKQVERALGQKVGPGFVIKEDTAAHKMDVQQRAFIDKLTPQQVDMVAAAATARDLGVPGMTTQQGMTDASIAGENRARAAKTSTASIADLIQEGADSIRRAPKGQRELAGQQAVMGTTLNSIEETDLGARLKSEATRDALKFVASPNSHPLGKLLRSRFGIDPTAAIAAIGMGMNQTIHDVAELTITNATNRGQRETAIQMRLAEAAGELSKATGYKLNPLDVQRVWSMREAGQDPSQVKGLAEASAVMDAAAEMGFRASMAAAVQAGDPTVKQIPELMQLLRSAKSKEEIAAGSRLLQGAAGKVYMTQIFGPRPALPGPQQTEWDRMSTTLGAFSSGVILKAPGFFEWSQSLAPTGVGVPGAAPPTGFGQRTLQSGAPGASTGRSITLPDNVTPEQEASIKQFMGAFLQTQTPQQPPAPATP